MNITRRTFIKSSCILGAGLSALPVLANEHVYSGLATGIVSKDSHFKADFVDIEEFAVMGDNCSGTFVVDNLSGSISCRNNARAKVWAGNNYFEVGPNQRIVLINNQLVSGIDQ